MAQNCSVCQGTAPLSGLFAWERKGRQMIQVKQSKASPPLEVSADAIAEYPYVMANRWHYPFVLIDVDEPRNDKAEALDPGYFENAGLPLPNTVTLTNRGWHGLWALQYPVARHGAGMNYYRHVRTTFNAVLNGDFSCAATAATRNPFYKQAEAACFGLWRYGLAKLDIPFNSALPCLRVRSTAYFKGNRNTATFLHLLACYKANPEADMDYLLNCAEAWQAEQTAPPLPRAENAGIAVSILRNGYRYALGNPNRGRLGLQPRESFLPLEEYKRFKAEHQAAGAAYATQCRMQSAKNRVEEAVMALESSGKVKTISEVARLSGVSRNTARKYLV